MAITNARMQIKRGNEVDFDSEKMLVGEWALSTDKKIVRICVAPNVCIRMATYDAFEVDMAKIEKILEECQTIEDAVKLINSQVSEKLQATIEYTNQAKQYRDEAKQFRDEAETFAPDGYVELKETVASNTAKIDTIIEKAELNIKNTASGENIHLTDSADGKAVEYALYGKATQDGTPSPENPVDIVVAGESYNFLPYPYSQTNTTQSGVTWTDNGDGTIVANGKATSTSFFTLCSIGSDVADTVFKPNTRYILSIELKNAKNISVYANVNGGDIAKIANKADGYYEVEFTTPSSYSTTFTVALYRNADGNTEDNCIIKPMIRKASVKNDRYMPYRKGSVEVKSVGNNLLKNTATSQTINDVTFTVNEDKSITASGTSTGITVIAIKDKVYLKKVGKYNLSGCPSGGSQTTYRLLFGIKKADGTFLSDIIDYGNGASFSITQEMIDSEVYGVALIYVFNGYTANNLTFYPMIRFATDTDSTYKPYKETLSTIPTTDFAGIKVDSNGNYTDNNGQQWIANEIVKYADGSGKDIKRIGVIDSYNGESITTQYMSTTGQLTVGAKVLYVLAEPIITDLSAEEIAEIEKLHTFYPVTNISNDADCGMSITYMADAKNYIDNRLALIESAMLNNI